jgi:negative regulator of sigma E activity
MARNWWIMNEAIRMQLSAFADGELPENEKDLLLRRLGQDVEMRRQVAEYLAIGRAIRGEAQFRGIDRLRERIAEEIGGISPEELEHEAPAEAGAGSDSRESGFARPVAGFAVAAAVALLAIFGLSQMTGVDDVSPESAGSVTAEVVSFPTQPEADRVLQQYRVLHDAEAATSYLRTRRTSLEGRQVLGVEQVSAAPEAADAADEEESTTELPESTGSEDE